jgi:hypothetical protein
MRDADLIADVCLFKPKKKSRNTQDLRLCFTKDVTSPVFLWAARPLMLPLFRLLPYLYLPDRSAAYTRLTLAVAAISMLSSYRPNTVRLHLFALCLPSYFVSLSHVYLIIL